jgi:hypothetical protein
MVCLLQAVNGPKSGFEATDAGTWMILPMSHGSLMIAATPDQRSDAPRTRDAEDMIMETVVHGTLIDMP